MGNHKDANHHSGRSHDPEDAWPVAKVDRIEHLGDQNHLHVSMGAHKLVTLVDPTTDLRDGDPVSLGLSNSLYFDDSGNRIRGGSA